MGRSLGALMSLVIYIALVISAQEVAAVPPLVAIPGAEVADKVRQKVGSPAQPGKQVGRSDIGISDTYYLHLDVGGEGRRSENGLETGFLDAININDTEYCTVCKEPNQPIPNLVRVEKWNTNPGYPFKNNCADYITMQNAPLTEKNVDEMARVLRKDGKICLWIDADFRPQILRLASKLNTTPIHDSDHDEFKGKAGHPKILIQAS